MAGSFCAAILVAGLLVQNVVCSQSNVRSAKRENRCYGNLGCFSNEGHFKGMDLPSTPAEIGASFHLFSHSTPHGTVISASNPQSITNAHFHATKPTIFVIHGYSQSIAAKWVVRMKDALLKKGDYNVILVDWKNGASKIYNVAVANLYVVAMETVNLLKHLEQHHSHPYDNVHLIGHSLGAHLSGYVGSKLGKVGRISGLDPAEPEFKGKDKSIILDPSDAHFVDVIHSDGSPFLGLQGFGLASPAGHVDFYPNGGQHQPGCSQDPLGSTIGDILHGGLSDVSKDLSCSHGRSHDFYVESILSHRPFRGHPCNSFADFNAGKCTGCGSHGCPTMGFPARSQGPRGNFYLATRPKTPYSGYEYYIQLRMANRNMEITYGDVFFTLIGSKGQSEEVRFLRQSQRLAKGTSEHYVVAVANDVGTISQVKIRFNRVKGFVAFGTTDDFAVHSVTVRTEAGGSSRTFCGHDELVHGTHALTSQSGC